MKNLSDTALVAELRSLVSREREMVTTILKYLREVEERKLFLTRGYSSLFAFCTGELGYSEPEAQLRIQSMRLMRLVPDVCTQIERGQLSMSVAAQIQSAAKREGLKIAQTQELVKELSGSSKREAEKKLAEKFPETPRPERARPISEELVEIRFTVTKEQAEDMQNLLDLRAHTNFDRRLEKLFSDLVREDLARRLPKPGPKREPKPNPKPEPKQQTKPNPNPIPKDAAPQRPGKVISRHIPRPTRRLVRERDQGCCQYQDPLTQRKCEAKHGLQLDHIQPFSLGGDHHATNLRLLCGAHNRARSG